MTDHNEWDLGTGATPSDNDNEWDWGTDPDPEPPTAAAPAQSMDEGDEWDWGEPDPEPAPTPRPWPTPTPAAPSIDDDEGWDEAEEEEPYEDDEEEEGPGALDRIKGALSEKKKIAGVAVAGVAVALAGVMFIGGGGSDEEGASTETVASTTQSTTTRPSTTTSSPEPGAKAVVEVEPFVEKLVKAMNDRDADAYYALLSPSAKETATESVARSAIEGLQEEAKYTYKVTEAEVLDDKAEVRFTLTATVGSSSSEQKMEMQLSEHDGQWLMELP